MSKKSKEERQRRREVMRASLEDHRRVGKHLVPPLATIPGLATQSWMNDRLPEMLWGCLLVGSLSRLHALSLFRRGAATLRSQAVRGGGLDVTLSGLAALDEPAANEFMAGVAGDPEARAALSGLLLLETLPGRPRWVRALATDVPLVGWNVLARGVAVCLDHQSQEATDVRWVRLVSQVVAGRLKFAAGMREQVEELVEYPNRGDMRSVRPSIRAGEASIDAMASATGVPRSTWPELFWRECMLRTGCAPANSTPPPSRVGTTAARLSEVSAAVKNHMRATRVSTGLDVRHDGAFGIALYVLALLLDVMRVGNASAILGRIALRAILEGFLTLAYLSKADDPNLWRTYRQYGSGQAKLAGLKLDGDGSPASAVSPETLDALANEDIWQEYITIDLGQWAGSDLRKMSEAAGEKGRYDKHYSWTSGFVHGNWAAVRNAVFTTCLNPLHRLHRVPREGETSLEDVVPDAVELCDGALGLLAKLYPPFYERLSIQVNTEP